MRKLIALELVIVALAALTLGAGCPTVPKIEDRIVEMALGASTKVEFKARGVINVYIETKTKDITEDINLHQILDDAGVDVSDLDDVKLAGISYIITKKDPETTRRITGNVRVHRGAGADTTLIQNFAVVVDSVTGYQPAPLTTQGVQFMNNLLGELLREAKGGPAATNTVLTYTVNGNSTPSLVNTDFDWELKIDLTIKGKIKVKVLG